MEEDWGLEHKGILCLIPESKYAVGDQYVGTMTMVMDRGGFTRSRLI
jgi:hypothetical protein